jgi:hypothetical protein
MNANIDTNHGVKVLTTWHHEHGDVYLYIGLLDVQRLLPQYKMLLLFFKRLINDGIRVWLDPPGKPNSWKNFFACLKDWGEPWWMYDRHVDILNFIDLNISIGPNRKIVYSTFQKEINLYIYVPPPGSARSTNMIHRLIFGCLQAYWLQNTYREDF